MEIAGFYLSCPRCWAKLHEVDASTLRCEMCGQIYACEDRIWRFLLPERLEYFRVFIDDYQLVRRAEGRIRQDQQYFRQLPFADISDDKANIWKIRAASYRAFVQRVLAPMEGETKAALRCIDLGAGNSWLSNRLVERGHLAAAVDLLTNDWDGLGALSHYKTWYLPLQAEFDRLPLVDQQCDLVIYNSSFHYSTDYSVSLSEALRVLKPAGKIVILDTPVYNSAESGKQMVREREQQFVELAGIPSNSLPSENYLTVDRIRELSDNLSIRWKFIRPFYGIRWAAKPWFNRLIGRREPAMFYLLVGEQIRSS